MKKKKRYLKYKKERVILSDVLPYEIPITFSNRYLYSFLIQNKIKIEGDRVVIGKNANDINKEIVKLLFGINRAKQFNDENKVKIYDRDKDNGTIPFLFKILHKEKDFRELALIHPRNQLVLVDFYEKYKELILYYCGQSPFSIRKPHRIAKYTYFNDKLHLEKLSESDEDIIEENDKEYDNLKTYFVYKKYSNIYKFYESYQYHLAEKKYNRLIKVDVSKCFDSIYTHSISWALIDKDVIKKYMPQDKEFFGSRFDTIMQKLNYNETNGIVIGPEFSRIFAELILQKIDLKVKYELNRERHLYKKDYAIYRYVDDYFVFYNDETVKEKILISLRLGLREFKLCLNDAKSNHYDKPIITELTIAKNKINDLMNNNISYKIQEVESELKNENETKRQYVGKIYIDSNNLITKIKTIIFESKVEYKDVMNYTFAIVERKLRRIVKDYIKIKKEKNTDKEIVKAILEVLEFVFFVYSVSPRVNTTIKLSRILRIVIEFTKKRSSINIDFKHLIYKKIYDNVFFVLNKNKRLKYTQIETLYLLIILRELGKDYWLSEDVLASYLSIKKQNNISGYSINTELNYFTIVVSLFYMGNKIRYEKLREFIFLQILDKFEKVDYNFRRQKTELILLLFDILAYPYIEIDILKRKLLNLYEISDKDMQDKIIRYREMWFTNWVKFRLGNELDSKLSQEVY